MKKINTQWVGMLVLALIIAAYQFTPTGSATTASFFKAFEYNPEGAVSVTSAENRTLFNLKDFNNAMVDIVDKTSPTVVTITTKETVQVQNSFMDFFQRDPRRSQGNERVRSGLGSGVIVSDEGYILTNNHVIDGADEVNVVFIDGEEVEATIIGTDPQTDIAVLQVDVENLPYVKLGDSDDTKVGEFVLAIGSPLNENLAQTVSFGIVSAKGRTIGLIQGQQQAGYEDFIQTDAAINPGNSGGALINMDGNLIGINSAIASRSGGSDGIGFSIPINLAKRIMEDLIEFGAVSRGYLGISGTDVDRTLAEGLGVGNVRGIIIAEVLPGTAADKAGLEKDDIITALNGEKLNSYLSFRTKISTLKPGDKAEFDVIRDGKSIGSVTATLEKSPFDTQTPVRDDKEEEMTATLGFSVQSLDAEINEQLGLEQDFEGVVVSKVMESSEAYERGLRRGDVITHVKRNRIANIYEFYEQIEGLLQQDVNVALLTVKRGENSQFIAFEL